MTRLEKLQAEYKALMAKVKELRKIDPADLSDEQTTEIREMLPKIENLNTDIAAEIRLMEIEAADTAGTGDNNGGGENRSQIEVKDKAVYQGPFALGHQLRDVIRLSNPQAPRAVKVASESRMIECANRSAAMVHEKDPESENRAAGDGMIEAVGSEGGFLLQSETSVDLFTHGFNNSVILPRCSSRTLTTATKAKIIGIDEASRADGSRGGGIRVYTTAELEAMTASKTKFNYVTIEPKKLTGLFYMSDEMLEDVALLTGEINDLFGEEFAFKSQDLIINGSGVGEPLGIRNAACVVEQDKEAGQAADTIVFENILKMRSRLWAGSRPRYIWLINADAEIQLCTMTLDVGTGGVAVWLPANGASDDSWDRLLAKSVTPIEQCQTVGDSGDIIAADFSQYITANKGGVNAATSIHLKFDYNQTTMRFIWRFDGRPRWVSAVTPKNGTNTVSPFVVLESR